MVFKSFFKISRKSIVAESIDLNSKKGRYDNSHYSQPSSLLLERQKRKIFDIKTSISISDELFEKLYMKMFSNIASIAQCVSASEDHHHSHLHGYLDHVFECVVIALRLREGFVYRSEQEDLIMKKKDVFTFAVTVGALCHDLGKLVTDIEFYDVDREKIHNVADGELPVNTEFLYRFYPGRNNEDHKAAGLIILRKIITKEGMNWILVESQLYRELIHCLSGNYTRAGKLGDLVRAADRHSTASSIKSVSDKYSATSSISNKIYNDMENGQINKTISNHNRNSRAIAIVDALRTCLKSPANFSSGKKLNEKGAFAWVTKEHIYVVHPKCYQLISNILESSGSKIKISQAIICYAILNDAGFIDQINEQHYAYFSVNDGNNWNAKLPMIRFFRDKIDPNFELVETTMEITHPSLEKSNSEQDNNVVSENKKQSTSIQESPISNDESPTPKNHEPVEQSPSIERDIINMSSDNLVCDEEFFDTPVLVKEAKEDFVTNQILDSFIGFLRTAFKLNSISINKINAPAHFVNGNLFLVSPIIFREYIKKVGIEKIVGYLGYDSEVSMNKLVKACQYEIFSCNYHIKDITKQNILTCSVQGSSSKKSNLSGVLFKEEFFKLITEEEFNNSKNVFLTSLIN